MGQYWRLRDAQGKPPGVMGWWPSRAVTFLDNHDTGSTQVIMSHKYIFYALRFINRVHMFAYFFFFGCSHRLIGLSLHTILWR